jgi:hypothetical protein
MKKDILIFRTAVLSGTGGNEVSKGGRNSTHALLFPILLILLILSKMHLQAAAGY